MNTVPDLDTQKQTLSVTERLRCTETLPSAQEMQLTATTPTVTDRSIYCYIILDTTVSIIFLYD